MVSVRTRFVEELSALLCKSLRLPAPRPPPTADEPLFGGRLPLDSVDSLQWAAAVEQTYGFALSERDIAAGALESLGTMADTLERRGLLPGLRADLETAPEDEVAE